MAKPLTTQFLDFGTGERFQSGGSFGWVSATPVAFRFVRFLWKHCSCASANVFGFARFLRFT